MKEKKPDTLHFKISSALKTLLGSDLITNPNVAVFELVKNGYDAGARRVDVAFLEDRIVIADNGAGMSMADILDKWLFVAYSGKKDSTRPGGQMYAGSKGVGRFASDRLGSRLRLQTRSKASGPIIEVEVDWQKFERDQEDEFIDIDVLRRRAQRFEVPLGVPTPEKGTVLIIESPRNEWGRQDLLRLRNYLTRLVDPFGARKGASLYITAPAERDADRASKEKAKVRGDGTAPEIVNGLIKSTLVQALTEGTTSITVILSPDGEHYETTLVDRGITVYRLREPNRYSLLATSEFDCRLFYLRRAAKTLFARRMGQPSVAYGSVFLFRNGYRVFPIGEMRDDFFGIDRRKQQGYARYLGTRDVIGRLNVTGHEGDFRESTSRDKGLIETAAVAEMRDAFFKLAFRRLESYVVDVSWPDLLDKDELEPGRLQTADAKQRIVHLLAGLTESDGVQLLEVAPDLDSILAEQFGEQEPALHALEVIAGNQHDEKLLRAVQAAKQRMRSLVVERRQAESRAEEEKAGRAAAEEKLTQISGALDEEKKRNLFLVAATPLDVQALQGFLHQITIQTTDVGNVADNAMQTLARNPLDREELQRNLERISWRAQQTLAVSKFATRANFRLETAHVTEDLSQFIEEYVQRVAPVWQDRIRVSAQSDGIPVHKTFRPIDLSIVVDNLVSNARRAGAHLIKFDLSAEKSGKGVGLKVTVTDDGRGLSPSISNPEDVFERGVSTTDGSGLGLWHVRHAMTESGGAVSITIGDQRSVSFVLTFPA